MQDDGAARRARASGRPGVDVDEFRPRDDAAAGGSRRWPSAWRQRAATPAARAARSRATPAAAAARAARARPGPRPARLLRRQADRLQGDRPAAGGVAARLPRPGAARGRRLRRLPRRPARALLDALADGDRDAVRAIAQAGRELEGGPRAPLRHLLAFLDRPPATTTGPRRRDLRERVVLTGRLEHDELAPLLAACEALVFPSTFPEAYRDGGRRGGGVRRAAGLGRALRVRRRSARMLAAAVPQQARGWLSFPIDDDAVRAIAARVRAWLQAPDDVRGRHAGRARGHGARALLVGGRGRRGRRGGAGTAGGAAARGLR